MTDKNQKILDELKSKSILSMGGTEAVSVAYSVAYARQKSKGELKKIQITVDSSIFKNGLNVIIPGCEERGLDFAAALGYVCGRVEDRLQLLSHYGEEEVRRAKKLLAQGKVSITIKDDCDKLYIETLIESSENIVRVLILDFHLNVISEEIVTKIEDLQECTAQRDRNYIKNEGLGLEDFIGFVEQVDLSELEFIREGLKYNLALTERRDEKSLTACFESSLERFGIGGDLITSTQNLCMRACEARIRGVKLPIMTAVGSANYGLAIYLAGYGVGSGLGAPEERILRAIALSNLMSLYVNSYVGSISAVCDCGFAVGIGTAVSTTYLLGGDYDAMERAVKTMLGSVTGIICEGNRLKCAWKIGLSVAWAIKSAFLAMESEEFESEGFLDNSLDRILENIAQIYNPLSNTINQTIVDIIMGK